jgi:cytochrome c biogenesis protein CcmG/thiol:disulfide interchange protein DsbE
MALMHEVAAPGISRRRFLRYALAGAAAVLMSACREGAKVSEGGRFPEIDLPYLDGRGANPAAFANRALVVNFWASWCEPCRREMPSLARLSALFSPEQLRVVGISVDNDINLAREFGLHYQSALQMLSDSAGRLSAGVLQIPSFPVTYLLRRDRSIARIVAGAQDWGAPEAIGEIERQLMVRRLGAG